jgi:hypothetical protein
MKRAFFALLLGLIFILGTTAATIAGPERITLKNSKGDVTFPHKAHQDLGYTCKTCHHTLEGDNDTPTQKCTECHTAESEVSNKDAFHGACTGCHKNYKKEHSDTKAPTSCSKCHKK